MNVSLDQYQGSIITYCYTSDFKGSIFGDPHITRVESTNQFEIVFAILLLPKNFRTLATRNSLYTTLKPLHLLLNFCHSHNVDISSFLLYAQKIAQPGNLDKFFSSIICPLRCMCRIQMALSKTAARREYQNRDCAHTSRLYFDFLSLNARGIQTTRIYSLSKKLSRKKRKVYKTIATGKTNISYCCCTFFVNSLYTLLYFMMRGILGAIEKVTA